MSEKTIPEDEGQVKDTTSYEHVEYLWDDAVAATLSPVDQLVYRSNLLGRDRRITNTGGGNTSAKLDEHDPLTDAETRVLWVKGSGGDLRTATRANFASLYCDKLQALDEKYDTLPERGLKSAAEDAMVGLSRHCVFNLNTCAPSIDTPLHSMVRHDHVDHLHATAVIAIASCRDQERLTREVWGGALAYVPWMRPGWEAARACRQAMERDPSICGVLLGQHGHTAWSSGGKSCYETSLWVIETAARFIASHDRGERTFGGQKHRLIPEATRTKLLAHLLPIARGLLSRDRRRIATVETDEAVLEFVNSFDAPRLAELGTSCPDHFLRTKIKPLFVDWDPSTADFDALVAELHKGVERYRQDYIAYYEANRDPASPPMRDPSPTVMLVPGVGMIAWGKDKSESRVTAEFYRGAIDVMRGAEAVSAYTALSPKEAFDIEYWPLEEAKLQRMPKPKALDGKVVVIVGAGVGIGRATALRVAQEGAHVVCADLNADAAKATADSILEKRGHGIGVAGSGIAGCGPALDACVDITKRQSVEEMLERVVLAYGGIDSVIITAGVFMAPGQTSHGDDEVFDRSFDVNVKGIYVVATAAADVWRAQKLSGELVVTTSVNAVVVKHGSLAYDTSKAAANHLIRELAVELAPWVRVNGLAPATVVAGSQMFPRERVLTSLRKYAIAFDESASDEELRAALASFYAQRTLIKEAITPQDQAEAAYLLISGALTKTTGQIITVDGGLPEAFLR